MKLTHQQTLLEAAEGAAKVTAMAYSPNGAKLAVCTVDRVVMLYDMNGERRDKFATKPAESGGAKNYVVKALAWSPDSTKLAVAQTDNIVFIYKLAQPEQAQDWDKKKSICNKFLQTSPVTCLTWPSAHANTVVYGLVEGKVRVGNLRNNKAQSLYNAGSMCIAVASSPDGSAIVSSHVDGKIFRYNFEEGRQVPLSTHTCPAYALAWGANIVLAGPDRHVMILSDSGRILQQFDHSSEAGEREPTVAIAAPGGQSVVIGSYDRLRVYNYTARRQTWDCQPAVVANNMYSVTAMTWKPDGSRVAVGTLCGAVELFDCSLRRTRVDGKFDLVYVSPSNVLVTILSTGAKLSLKSNLGLEIEKVNLLSNDRFVVANTSETLLLGNVATGRVSELSWKFTGAEKFYFEHPACCLIFAAGELSVVEYGVDEILGTARTEYMNPHLLSVCVGSRHRRDEAPQKKLAYMVDLYTINVLDLSTGDTAASIEHDSKIDWLEMNDSGKKLLFRDKRHRLHLFDFASGERSTLLPYCSYVQWVPNSDVVVAQNRSTLCIWYNIEHPDRVTTLPIKGDVVDIERSPGKTEVVVDEEAGQVSYMLDEGLIEFGTAVEDGDFQRAVAFLETLELTPESKTMWSTLSRLAFAAEEYAIAQRCAVALGDIAKANYLAKVNQLIYVKGRDAYEVQAALAALNQHFKLAETIYLEQGQTEAAMRMYQTLHKWSDAVAVAEARNHPDLHEMRNNYSRWLTETGQEETAGEMRESAGDYQAALTYYMKAGLPGKAALLIGRHPELLQSRELIERVGAALMRSSLYDRAGELFEKAQMAQRALEAYRQGNLFAKAVELSRHAFPNEVVRLEAAWGEYLVSQKQHDVAIPHFIEAGRMEMAIEAAIAARQWAKAAQVVDMQDEATAKPYYRVLAAHYAQVRDFASAEKYYVLGQDPRAAIDMYVQAGKWEAAHKLAVRHMQKEDVSNLYVAKAQSLEAQHKYKEAEQVYLMIEQPDDAITMYKHARQYDDMTRLVKQYRPDFLLQTHLLLAKELEDESHFSQAEHHYVCGEDWKAAVNMYRGREMWDDAYRVAKSHGGTSAAQQVAFLWAHALGGDSAVKLLTKLDALQVGIDYACKQLFFDFAFELAKAAAPERLSDVHCKYAIYLEDEGRVKEAEDEFIKAKRPKEAVLMYVHAQDWDSAQRVAELHHPESVSDVMVGQARVAFQDRDFAKAEMFLLRAQRPELAVRYYQEAGLWQDALRLAQEYLPHKVEEIQRAYEAQRGSSTASNDVLAQGRMCESRGDHAGAIRAYLMLEVDSGIDADTLQEAYEKAAELAYKFTPNRATEVVAQVCKRLVQMQRYSVAADLYAGVAMLPEAIQACMQGDLWERAKALAAEMEDESIVQAVQEAHVRHLKQRQDPSRLADVDVVAGLDLFVQNGQWEQCIQAAVKHGGQILNKYVALYAAHLLQNGMPDEALRLFAVHGAPPSANNHNLYRRLAADLFADPSPKTYKQWADLRELLLGVTTATSGSTKQEFDRLTRVAHYFALREAAKSIDELKEIATCISVSLIRYTDVVPADRAFYEAGSACKNSGKLSMAFVLLNRFLDLSEAIEEGSLDAMDNTDFVGTDVPFEVPLPDSQFVSEDERADLKEWVLTVSMDQSVDQVLDTDSRGVFVASLLDSKTGQTSKPCILTGYPVLGQGVELNDGKVALRESWNQFAVVVKTTHRQALSDVLRFLGQWCGAPSNLSYTFG